MPNLVLACGPITNTDQLVVELVTPLDTPVVVLIRWPGCPVPSVFLPTRFPAAALAAIAVLDNALQELTRAAEERR